MRKTEWVDAFNVRVVPIAQRPDHPQLEEVVYVVKDLFTTRDGSWEPSSVPGSVPQWARDAYLKPWHAPDVFDDAGADHHLFSRVLDLAGNPIPNKKVAYWSDGLHKLADPTYTHYAVQETKTKSGWANVVLSPDANYVPERGESGPWSWCPTGVSDVVTGAGMPSKWHVSFFVVWQAVRALDLPGGETGSGDDAATSPGTGGDAGPGPSGPYPPGLAGVRQAAWDQVGVSFNPQAAFARYARAHGLGIPLTDEFDVNEFRVQGYVMGIVFAPIGQWDRIGHIDW